MQFAFYERRDFYDGVMLITEMLFRDRVERVYYNVS
jgi:hypothetical protein